VPFTGLDAWLRPRAADELFSGVVLIRRGDTTVFSGAYGWASRRWAVPVSPDTRFDTDLVRFGPAVRAGRLLSAELTEQFLTPQVLHHQREDRAVWCGFGLEFVTDRNGRRVRNHHKDGGSPGVSGILRYCPAGQLDVAVLSNAGRGA